MPAGSGRDRDLRHVAPGAVGRALVPEAQPVLPRAAIRVGFLRVGAGEDSTVPPPFSIVVGAVAVVAAPAFDGPGRNRHDPAGAMRCVGASGRRQRGKSSKTQAPRSREIPRTHLQKEVMESVPGRTGAGRLGSRSIPGTGCLVPGALSPARTVLIPNSEVRGSTPAPGVAERALAFRAAGDTGLNTTLHRFVRPRFSARARKTAPGAGALPFSISEFGVKTAGEEKSVRATDAKEVGVGNPAEETFCNPNRRA